MAVGQRFRLLHPSSLTFSHGNATVPSYCSRVLRSSPTVRDFGTFRKCTRACASPLSLSATTSRCPIASLCHSVDSCPRSRSHVSPTTPNRVVLVVVNGYERSSVVTHNVRLTFVHDSWVKSPTHRSARPVARRTSDRACSTNNFAVAADMSADESGHVRARLQVHNCVVQPLLTGKLGNRTVLCKGVRTRGDPIFLVLLHPLLWYLLWLGQ